MTHRQPPYISGKVNVSQVVRGRGSVVNIKLTTTHATRCPPVDLHVDGAKKSRPVNPPQQIAVYYQPFNRYTPELIDEVFVGLLTGERWTRNRGPGPAYIYEATLIVDAEQLLGDDQTPLQMLTAWWIGRESVDLVVRFPMEDKFDDEEERRRLQSEDRVVEPEPIAEPSDLLGTVITRLDLAVPPTGSTDWASAEPVTRNWVVKQSLAAEAEAKEQAAAGRQADTPLVRDDRVEVNP